MASLVKICEICRENLITKYGTCSSSSVSLFNETLNKEFSSVLAGKPVILAKLLQSLGICVALNRRSVCKKCARKVVNCYKLYKELKEAFEDTAVEETQSTSSSVASLQNRRRGPVVHERSPTGVTPTAKRQKGVTKAGENKTKPTSKRALFEEPKVEDEYSFIDDEISQLMNIPVSVEVNTPPIAKVR